MNCCLCKNHYKACGGEGGDMYKQCFKSDETYVDNFGDEVAVLYSMEAITVGKPTKIALGMG